MSRLSDSQKSVSSSMFLLSSFEAMECMAIFANVHGKEPQCSLKCEMPLMTFGSITPSQSFKPLQIPSILNLLIHSSTPILLLQSLSFKPGRNGLNPISPCQKHSLRRMNSDLSSFQCRKISLRRRTLPRQETMHLRHLRQKRSIQTSARFLSMRKLIKWLPISGYSPKP